MKCIYCNDETNLTISDIIPAALTGVKLRKKFVCRVHNSFTNDHYEKAMIRQLDIFRNRIGLTERDGDSVRFSANLTIGEYTSQKNIIVSDNSSIMDSDRLFRMEDKQGNTVLVGPKNKLLKINRVEPNKIIDLPLEDISISSKADIRDLFISETVLHAVAKIAYEWHCYINDVEEFQEETYGMITSYILNPEQENTLVNIVNDAYVKEVADRFSRTGSNMLFEYNDPNRKIYVIFCLWNVITYKVKIGMHNKKPSMVHCPIAYFYHADGSQNGVMFGVYGNFHVNATSPNVGISELYSEIKFRLSKLGERDLSKEYLQNCIAKISKKLPAYEGHKISIADLLDFEHEDRIIPNFGILLNANGRTYAIPLSSAKPKHKTWKNINQECYLVYEYAEKSKIGKNSIWTETDAPNIVKHILSIIDIKKMIPVKEGTYSIVNLNKSPFDTLKEEKYKDLLNKEYSFCLKNIDSIIVKASKLYAHQMTTGKVKKFCCDFKMLEDVCDNYEVAILV